MKRNTKIALLVTILALIVLGMIPICTLKCPAVSLTVKTAEEQSVSYKASRASIHYGLDYDTQTARNGVVDFPQLSYCRVAVGRAFDRVASYLPHVGGQGYDNDLYVVIPSNLALDVEKSGLVPAKTTYTDMYELPNDPGILILESAPQGGNAAITISFETKNDRKKEFSLVLKPR